MKQLLSIIALLVLFSCNSKTEDASQRQVIREKKDVVVVNKEIANRDSVLSFDKNDLPEDGKYRYDIAFAGWEGKSMGEKVTVFIKGDSIRVMYEGDGQLTMTNKGDILDEGILRKHKSGEWIIAQQEEDVYAEEFGGCTDGPTVIDFEGKKYWKC